MRKTTKTLWELFSVRVQFVHTLPVIPGHVDNGKELQLVGTPPYQALSGPRREPFEQPIFPASCDRSIMLPGWLSAVPTYIIDGFGHALRSSAPNSSAWCGSVLALHRTTVIPTVMTSKIRSELTLVLRNTSEDKRRLKIACQSVVTGMHLLLQIFTEAAGHVGVPGIKAGVSGLLFIVEIVKKTNDNARVMEKLVEHIGELMDVLQKAKNGETYSAAMLKRIDRLFVSWSTAAQEVRNIASRHILIRVFYYSDVSQVISDSIQAITWSIQSFMVETLLAMEFSLDEHVCFMRNTAARIEEKVDNGFQEMKARFDIRDGRLPHAIFAQFGCKYRDCCLEGTRTNVLTQIYSWMDVEAQESPDDVTQVEQLSNAVITKTTSQKQSIFWVNGSAGTGKTTIACTVAEACKARGILGASFFCSRDDAECSNPNLIFTTIALQLGQYCPLFDAEVTRVLKSKLDIGNSSVPYQLEELIVKPLRAVGMSFPQCVVVLDALDECKDSTTTSIILSSLSRHVADLQPLKILITSRPEPQLTSVFNASELNPVTQRLVLHDIGLGVVQYDIDLYFAANLRRIRNYYGLEDSWPTRDEILALVRLSFGLFIFAATATKYIEDRNYSDPKHQLAILLSKRAPVADSPSSPYHHLNDLYTQVLLGAFPDMSSHLAGRLKMILGSIILLYDPLTPPALERLLNLGSNTVRMTLVHLNSVVIVPEDDAGVIRLLHPSFFDFMTDPTRCLNPRFLVDTKTQHTMLAYACLGTLCGLRRDMCEIKDPLLLNSEVDDLPIRIMQYIPLHLQYACRYWTFHLENGMLSDTHLEGVETFCSKYLLYWIEVCSLLGEVRNALMALAVARQVVSRTCKKILVNLLEDSEHFTLQFFSLISVSSLQVYHSALAFTPQGTPVYENYRGELLHPVKLCHASDEKWSLCIRSMEGSSGSVWSVAFSPDGMRVVSGSFDKTLRLWDAFSGAHLSTFHGHSREVLSVAFSPDGMRIASGSYDKTLRLWDAVSCAHLSTLHGHSAAVQSVAFSPDGTHIVSGSEDKTIRLWNAVGGAHRNTLNGHSGAVQSVEFSPDATRIVSGSFDKTIRLWDTVSGAPLNTLHGHSDWVQSVTFSPDGMFIMSGSWDNTLRLWDAVSGVHLNTLHGHSDSVISVAFSPDGTRIASGSWDNTLRLWDAVSGVHLNTLRGHSEWVRSVAFSPDGTRVVSGSWDRTVRLWDAVSGTHLNTLQGHSGWFQSSAFSPDNMHVMSGSSNKTP